MHFILRYKLLSPTSLTFQMQTIPSIDVVTINAYGYMKLIVVISAVWPSKKSSRRLYS